MRGITRSGSGHLMAPRSPSSESGRRPDRAVLVALDLASGQERPLNVDISPRKRRWREVPHYHLQQRRHTIGTTRAGRGHPTVAAFSSSRDHRTRPWVVDIKTGKRHGAAVGRPLNAELAESAVGLKAERARSQPKASLRDVQPAEGRDDLVRRSGSHPALKARQVDDR